MKSNIFNEFSKIYLLTESEEDFVELDLNYNYLNKSNLEKHLRDHGKFDAVLTPSQVSSVNELLDLFRYGRKVAIIQLDYIAADNSTYFATSARYFDYRDAASLSLVLADLMIFNSRHVYLESQRYGNRQRASNDILGLGNGIEKYRNYSPSVTDLDLKQDVIVVLGTTFSHKNRAYAIRLFEKVLEVLPEYKLLLIGPNPEFGSSTGIEKDYLASMGSLAERVIIKPWIAESELLHAVRTAKLVLIPSISEGFGLVPGEAAQLGTASIFPYRHSLKEVYPEVPISLKLENVDDDTESILNLLQSTELMNEQIEYVASVADSNSWENISKTLFTALYNMVITESYASGVEVMRIRYGTKHEPERKLLNSKFVKLCLPVGSMQRQTIIKIYKLLRG